MPERRCSSSSAVISISSSSLYPSECNDPWARARGRVVGVWGTDEMHEEAPESDAAELVEPRWIRAGTADAVGDGSSSRRESPDRGHCGELGDSGDICARLFELRT